MAKFKEDDVIKLIKGHMDYKGRYFVNFHGTVFTQNGTPDILTHDADGIFCGIEAKVDGRHVFPNQWQRGVEILTSGGRFIVAVSDFDIDLLDDHQLPIEYIPITKGVDDMDEKPMKIKHTTEFKLIDD